MPAVGIIAGLQQLHRVTVDPRREPRLLKIQVWERSGKLWETNGLDGEFNDFSEVKSIPDGRHEITELLWDDTLFMIARSDY